MDRETYLRFCRKRDTASELGGGFGGQAGLDFGSAFDAYEELRAAVAEWDRLRVQLSGLKLTNPKRPDIEHEFCKARESMLKLIRAVEATDNE